MFIYPHVCSLKCISTWFQTFNSIHINSSPFSIERQLDWQGNYFEKLQGTICRCRFCKNWVLESFIPSSLYRASMCLLSRKLSGKYSFTAALVICIRYRKRLSAHRGVSSQNAQLRYRPNAHKCTNPIFIKVGTLSKNVIKTVIC